MIDILLDLLDPKPEQREKIKQDLQEAIDKNNIEFIKDGFFYWQEIRKNDKLYIWISNMYIKPEGRKKGFFWVRSFMRNKYPSGIEFFYWLNEKKNKYYYVKGD